jgi:hypothetical protein
MGYKFNKKDCSAFIATTWAFTAIARSVGGEAIFKEKIREY